jgi:4-phospho-D-threonate 3-dehydrogenase / 4-phospho-D-erythronate 3-dehydrogenase
MNDALERPSVALTMGDVAGIGPEVIVKAWADPGLHALARPLVIGDPDVLERARSLTGCERAFRVQVVGSPEEADSTSSVIPCLTVAGVSGDLADVPLGHVDARAGRAAYQFLIKAAELAIAGRIDAITTLPLNKLALHQAGVVHPGHTEILAEFCKTPDHAMMLYLENDKAGAGAIAPKHARRSLGLGVVHVTLHVALKKVFELITIESVLSKIQLADRAMRPLTDGSAPRVAVTSLNPHAGEEGLFGTEEQTLIAPAVLRAQQQGIDVQGPFPNDTLFYQALAGDYDAVVAMYHDQGHIALKTVGFDRAVNVTLGLPIVRTSVAHGTAFDIAGKGMADPSSLIAAVRVAAKIVAGRVRAAGVAGPR